MGKIWCKLWAKFDQFMCHILPMVFLHSKFLKDFNSHSRTGVTRVSQNHDFKWYFNSHSHTRSDKSIHTKSSYLLRNLFFVFLPYNRILPHKRAFFYKNLKPSHLEFYKFNADSVIQHLCIKFSCVVNILKKIA